MTGNVHRFGSSMHFYVYLYDYKLVYIGNHFAIGVVIFPPFLQKYNWWFQLYVVYTSLQGSLV